MGEEDEQMQTQDQIAALNRALVLQNRSALQYSLRSWRWGASPPRRWRH